MKHNIYGSSCVGIKNTNKRVTALAYNIQGGVSDIIIPETINPLDPVKRSLGEKQYELSNHLGNVLVTVSDRKLAEGTEGSTATGYRAEVLFTSDYYPFGMQMPGREFSAEDYRYGFNGMEKDDEWKGEGNSYDFGARMYDATIGRWLSLDPLSSVYPWVSDYSFVANNPLSYVDPDGEKIVFGTQFDGSKTTFSFRFKVRSRLFVAALMSKTAREAIRDVKRDPNRILTINQTTLNQTGPIVQIAGEYRDQKNALKEAKDLVMKQFEELDLQESLAFNEKELAVIAEKRNDLESQFNVLDERDSELDANNPAFNGEGSDAEMYMHIEELPPRKDEDLAIGDTKIMGLGWTKNLYYGKDMWMMNLLHEMWHARQIFTGTAPAGSQEGGVNDGVRKHEVEAVEFEQDVNEEMNRWRRKKKKTKAREKF
ncbi:MAG: RHS repeat-associated protein [Roseivirga sp.]